MKNKIFIIIIMAAMLLNGCQSSNITVDSSTNQSTGIEHEENADQVEEDKVYSNVHLGFEFTVPKDWWIYEMDPINLVEGNADVNADASVLNVAGDDGYSSLSLITLANLQYSSSVDHLEIRLQAEKMSGIWSLTEFEKDYVEFTLENNKDLEAELVSTEKVEINGKEFTKTIIRFGKDDEAFETATLICEANNGYFLSFSATYWAEMSMAAPAGLEDIVSQNVKFIELTGEE